MIDGAVIGNNPSLYAYIMAKDVLKNPKVRLLNIATGHLEYPSYADRNNINWFDYLYLKFYLAEFATGIDMNVVHYYLKNIMPKGTYHRCDIVTDIALDGISE